MVVSAGGDGSPISTPLARAVRHKEGDARLSSLQARLEAGCAEAGLPQLEPQAFSNEEQMLQQAALWQQQAAEARRAERQHRAEAAAESMRDGWEPAAADDASSDGGSPSPAQLAAVQRQLEEFFGLPADEATAVSKSLPPAVVADWNTARAVVAVAWLQQHLSSKQQQLDVRAVAKRAPLLLILSSERLEQALRFAQRTGQEAGSNSSSSGIVASMGSLLESAELQIAEQQAMRQAQQQVPTDAFG